MGSSDRAALADARVGRDALSKVADISEGGQGGPRSGRTVNPVKARRGEHVECANRYPAGPLKGKPRVEPAVDQKHAGG
jgi:hypothetical protein